MTDDLDTLLAVDAKLTDLVVAVVILVSIVVVVVVVVNANAEFIELFVTNFGIEFLSLGTLSLCLAI